MAAINHLMHRPPLLESTKDSAENVLPNDLYQNIIAPYLDIPSSQMDTSKSYDEIAILPALNKNYIITVLCPNASSSDEIENKLLNACKIICHPDYIADLTKKYKDTRIDYINMLAEIVKTNIGDLTSGEILKYRSLCCIICLPISLPFTACFTFVTRDCKLWEPLAESFVWCYEGCGKKDYYSTRKIELLFQDNISSLFNKLNP